MDQPAGLQVDYVFRGVEHAVRVVVSGQVLELEVEDRMTADQWRGQFDASFIEDLTHKTGNFKQFNIFCNMLESALTQSSESVTLDLLTYTDLESLRNRKMGSRSGPLASRSAQLNSKRYLILIYSVEFDRIHYPLPLPYQGKPDPVVLQGIIRSLKEELGRLRGLDGPDARDTRDTEIWHLREQVSRLASEKRELEAQLGQSREEALAGRAARQEAEALRGLVRGLELELRQERGLGHRGVSRRSQDCRRLAKELEEVKASERSLRARLRTVNTELAVYKKGRRTPPVPQPRAREDRASSSRERSTSRGRGATRSSSRESGRGGRGRGRPARPSPSPTGSRAPRFDPTAFVKAKEKKQREIKLRQQQQRNRLGSGGSGDGPSLSWSRQTRPPAAVSGRGDAAHRSRNRSSSVDSFRSRCSSASSCSELEDFSESLPRGVRRHGKPPSPTTWGGPRKQQKSTPLERSHHQRRLTSSGGWVPMKEYSSDHQAADMAEIDARLKALQEYMNRLDTRS
ncbi:centrosomal protein CCDC61 isoform X1 [Mustela nigripes]|uniref:Centrosomal protein CCDC61 n=1 Tax=Mustela putorius furo TaxID=9669 RepID=M3Y238_MUSPF|nr:centrosomal protein CCDC61 isoform X1 [Mustela putorius furo]XP_012919531.1 centrosomal protein CCDC61 isoform X1 [Mustela putorius furo]XP_059239225.1 centrosomal protein CCDC61 isoform X1 [Mustela nigripes]XP_059239226.1 centrosomal protein CCDC61 isoform X1 [Mustela nigripes]XP_059239227.1 centrosomal protein CCDC61 isoform X1 [Mustela nigripes]XP_059239228.1 centrosomal protein CCDC61 isoform X1 [Mustela nigripes]